MTLILFVLSAVTAGCVLHAGAHSENLHEFTEMCKIYNLLVSKPEDILVGKGSGRVGPLAEAQEIWDEIELYNLSTAPKNLLDIIKEAKAGEDASSQVPQHEELREKLKQIPNGPTGNGRGKPKFPIHTQVTASRARQLISKIRAQAEATRSKIGEVERSARAELDEARKHMIRAVYGVSAIDHAWGKEEQALNSDWTKYVATAASFASHSGGRGSAYANGCTSTGGEVGKSLVGDFCCICGIKTGANGNNVCENSMDSLAEKHYNTDAGDGVERWKVIKAGCEKLAGRDSLGTPSPGSLRAAVALHRAMLGKNWVVSAAPTNEAASKERSWILGRYVLTAANAAGCLGGSVTAGNGEGVCVDYKEIVKTGEIPWVKEVLKAAQELEKVEKKKAKIEVLLSQMKSAEHQAELIYEDALLSGNREPASQPGSITPGRDTKSTEEGKQQLASTEVQAARGKTISKLFSETAVLLTYLL